MSFAAPLANDNRRATAITRNRPPLGNIPSRHSNPFATCWTRPGAMAFRFQPGQSADELIRQLAHHDWRGEILGPHGSGKSTLLATLVPRIEAAGRIVRLFALRRGTKRLPDLILCTDLDVSLSRMLLVIDGYEQLGWTQRVRLRRFCRRWRTGLLITSHSPAGLPTLADLRPDFDQLLELVGALCEPSFATIDPQDVAASHARHGSNVREIFFDLYDRYEEQRRARRDGTRFAS